MCCGQALPVGGISRQTGLQEAAVPPHPRVQEVQRAVEAVSVLGVEVGGGAGAGQELGPGEAHIGGVTRGQDTLEHLVQADQQQPLPVHCVDQLARGGVEDSDQDLQHVRSGSGNNSYMLDHFQKTGRKI